jgi:hypothetical protein
LIDFPWKIYVKKIFTSHCAVIPKSMDKYANYSVFIAGGGSMDLVLLAVAESLF